MGTGHRPGANIDHRWATIKDLHDPSIVNYLSNQPVSVATVGGTSDNSPQYGDDPPQPPHNLQLARENDPNRVSAYNIVLSWTMPADDTIEYVEVWVNTENNRDTATRRGVVTAPGNEYLYSGFDPQDNHYFWIRSRGYNGQYSTWSPTQAQGGYLVTGNGALADTIDQIVKILKGGNPPAFDNEASYDSGVQVVDLNGRVWESATTISPTAPGTQPEAPDWQRTGLLMEGDVDGQPTVAIDGNLVVDQTILARHIQAASITADKMDMNQAFVGMTIQSSNFVEGYSGWQLHSDGVLKIESDGSEIIVGNSVNGDYLAISEGDVKFFYWDGTTHHLYKSLKRREEGITQHDVEVEIPGYFKSTPSVDIIPKSTQTYLHSMAQYEVDQILQCQALNIEEFNPTTGLPETGTGRWRFTTQAVLTASSGGTWSDSFADLSGSSSVNMWWYHYWMNVGSLTTPQEVTPANTTEITFSGNASLHITLFSFSVRGLRVEVYCDILAGDTTSGPGGDGQHLLLQHSWAGDDITDYTISAPIPNTTISLLEDTHTYQIRLVCYAETIGDGVTNHFQYTLTNTAASYLFTPADQGAAGDVKWIATGE